MTMMQTFPVRALIEAELRQLAESLPPDIGQTIIMDGCLCVLDAIENALAVARPWRTLIETCKPFVEFDTAERAGFLRSVESMHAVLVNYETLRGGEFARFVEHLPRTMAQFEACAEEIGNVLDAASVFSGISGLRVKSDRSPVTKKPASTLPFRTVDTVEEE